MRTAMSLGVAFAGGDATAGLGRSLRLMKVVVQSFSFSFCRFRNDERLREKC